MKKLNAVVAHAKSVIKMDLKIKRQSAKIKRLEKIERWAWAMLHRHEMEKAGGGK